MLLEKLDTPITVLNVGQYEVNVEAFQRRLGESYFDYEWDRYLLQQNKITLIRELVPQKALWLVPNSVWSDIYVGVIQDSDFQKLFPSLTSNDIFRLASLKPTRKRCVSEYELNWKGNWSVDRIPSQPFSQSQALIAAHQDMDYRLSARRFKELPEELFDDDLRLILTGVADMVKQARPSVLSMNIVVHHTIVYCHPEQVSTNSPEGIHQDGMDFIVSALVVERKNISGGKSIIYGRDRKTKLLQIELQAGQGIFQADAGTDLWHEVTPITTMNHDEAGYRSTIGFDVMSTRDTLAGLQI